MKSMLRAYVRRIAVAIVAGLLGAAAVALALLALYFFAIGFLGPMLAALVTAGGALVLAGLIMLGGCACRMGHRRARPASGANHSRDPAEIANQAMRFLRRNPKKSVGAALVTGLVLGASPKLRRSLIRVAKELADSGDD
jgi:hypothetical protein